MSKSKLKREEQAVPPVKGLMICKQDHQWEVKDLNPKRKTVKCPVCGGNTSISEGLTQT